jgi:hypothetical protein
LQALLRRDPHPLPLGLDWETDITCQA